MRVLTWNLFHGRSLPPVDRDLSGEFRALIAGWDWDVALLQEVPPWWPGVLGRAAEAQQCRVLTSRNSLGPLRSPAGAEKTDVAHVARRDVDHIFTRGMEAVGRAELLDRRVEQRQGDPSAVELSDHLPLLVSVQPA